MPSRTPLRALAALPLVLAALGLAACGEERTGEEVAGGGETQAQQAPQAPTVQAGLPEGTEEAPKQLVDAIGEEPGERPEIPTPEGDPPEGLRVSDLKEGTGAVLAPGATVSVQYLGANWSNGETFDTNFEAGGQPFQFPLGGGQVIPGWDQGLVGMRQGGRRLLVIPPDLAYGEQGSPDPTGGDGGIPPNETLIFVIDAL